MKNQEAHSDSAFRKQAVKSIYAIILFILVYLVIMVLVLALSIVCLVGALSLMAASPSLVTLGLGIGMISLGVMVVIFLFKFIFEGNKIDRSHLIEVHPEQEPALFAMIRDIVSEVGTAFPKKIYFSSEVNASVFYDSGFWSMFLPVKKNLQIGVGLINTVSRNELKAILSHEFGHFSQRSMKIGSYVYNVNQIIFNILYNNDTYNNMTQKWANMGWFIGVFALIAVKINAAIQWILRKLYGVVNKSYMGLSREMEYHADAIAAGVTGYEPLKVSLLRMSMADNALENAVQLYNTEAHQNIRSENIFKDQLAVMYYWTEDNNLPVANGFPLISLYDQNKYDKSKLMIKDQWASHPPMDERIARMEATGIANKLTDDSPANDMFVRIEDIQKEFTDRIFTHPDQKVSLQNISNAAFIGMFKNQFVSNSFSKLYNGYYNNKNPLPFDMNQIIYPNDQMTHDDFLSDKKVDLVYSYLSLQNDIQTLKNISTNEFPVKVFHYDGVRYRQKEAADLVVKLESELITLTEKIRENDAAIYFYFKKKEEESGRPAKLEKLYIDFFQFDKEYDLKYELYTRMMNGLQFIMHTTPFEIIKRNLQTIRKDEELLAAEIRVLMAEKNLESELTPIIKEGLEKYISQEWVYFNGEVYNDNNLEVLFSALNHFSFLLSRKYFLLKKELLDYQEGLIRPLILMP